jgi:cytochrome b561
MKRYSTTAILLHWLMSLLIIAAFILGTIMTDIPGITPTKLQYYAWHKWLGVTILGLVAFRLIWRLTHPIPAYTKPLPLWQERAAHIIHISLYVFMFTLPLTGSFYSLAAGIPVVYLNLFQLPVLIAPNATLKPILKETHEILSNGLLIAFVLHAAAALKHHFIDKDDILKRMLPSTKE